jgi:hypothetical protein
VIASGKVNVDVSALYQKQANAEGPKPSIQREGIPAQRAAKGGGATYVVQRDSGGASNVVLVSEAGFSAERGQVSIQNAGVRHGRDCYGERGVA